MVWYDESIVSEEMYNADVRLSLCVGLHTISVRNLKKLPFSMPSHSLQLLGWKNMSNGVRHNVGTKWILDLLPTCLQVHIVPISSIQQNYRVYPKDLLLIYI